MTPSLNPPIHQTIHATISEGVSTDFTSSNRIELSQFVQDLLHFLVIWGVLTYGGCGWVGVGGWVEVLVGGGIE